MNAHSVLICGTNYGRTYLEAAQLRPDTYIVRGILARGSERSTTLAGESRLPLYTSVSQVPDFIDIACVVVGSSVEGVVTGLLNRGIHILAEHPQRPETLKLDLDKAAKQNLCLHVNPHFSDLTAPVAFIRHCGERLQESEPRMIQVIAADRALYGTLDLIHQSFGSLSTLRLDGVDTKGEFIVIDGTFGRSSLSLWLQSARDGNHRIPDGSSRYSVDMRVAIVFGTGTLSLLSLAGPVIWNDNLLQSTDSTKPIWDRVYEAVETRVALYEQRIRANVVALDRLRRQIETGCVPPSQSPGVLLEISQVWEDVSSKINCAEVHD